MGVPDESGQLTTAGRFETEMERIFSEHPELLDDPDREILVVSSYGSEHTPLFHRARAAGVPVERSFPNKQKIYSCEAQTKRMIALGKEPSQEFLSFAYTEYIVSNVLAQNCEDRDARSEDAVIVTLSREIASKITFQEAARIYHMSRFKNPEQDINTILAKKGMEPLPVGIEAINAWHKRRADEYAAKVEAAYADMHRRQAVGDS
jgi:hypothetical protein